MPTNRQCSCTTSKDTQCSFHVRGRKRFCGHHEECKRAWLTGKGLTKRHTAPGRKMFKKSIKHGKLKIKGTQFQYEVIIRPNKHLPEIKERIINKFGDRLSCLGITKEIVEETMGNDDYMVIAFIKNTTQNDEASGALQYWDWCNTGNKQLWIGDLCRLTEVVPKPVVSPVEALLELFSSIAKANNLRKIHLMVNDDNGNNIKVLPRIYNKYRFFKINL